MRMPRTSLLSGLAFITLFLLCSCTTLAQGSYSTIKTVKKGLAEDYKEANLAYQINKYGEAISTLEKITKKAPDFIDAWILLGEVQFDFNRYAEAEAAYERAIALDANYWSGIWQKVARAETKLDKYDEAIAHLNAYLATNPKADRKAKVNRQLEQLTFIRDARANPVPFDPIPLPGAVNTENMEYFPCLSADEQTLVFTRRERGQEDLYVSRLTPGGAWEVGQPLDNINTN